MNGVAHKFVSTMQLVEIHLWKAYLQRALRCRDSDSDSIYCLANVYLAVLYYTTGQYQTALDHCTLVMRSQDHSQCSSHVLQGELLPHIDDNIDNALGLAVFYQYILSATSDRQQQRQYCSVFTTELFAYYLNIKLTSVTKCPVVTGIFQQYLKCMYEMWQIFVGDILVFKLLDFSLEQNICCELDEGNCNRYICVTELDTSELVELLQKAAVEYLTTCRQLDARQFRSVATIVTTDYEALYAYKLGNYQRCLLLSTQNVQKLLYVDFLFTASLEKMFIPLLDDDIVSLTALMLVVNPVRKNEYRYCNSTLTQLTLSLYLMTQCQLKLRHSVTSLAQTLNYIKLAQTRIPPNRTLDHLTLHLASRKIVTY